MFGRQLKTYFSEAQIELICNNHITEHMGNEIRVFDLTEEKNSTVALQLLKGSRLRPVV